MFVAVFVAVFVFITWMLLWRMLMHGFGISMSSSQVVEEPNFLVWKDDVNDIPGKIQVSFMHQ